MADARRCLGGRGHRAFLTCLMMAVMVVVIIQCICCSSNGPAYSLLHSSVTRPESVLSQLEVLTPAKERPYEVLMQSMSQQLISGGKIVSRDKSQSFASIIVADKNVAPPASVESHFILVEPEDLKPPEEFSSVDVTAPIFHTTDRSRESLGSLNESMSEVSVALIEQVVSEVAVEKHVRAETESLEIAKDVFTDLKSPAVGEESHNVSELNRGLNSVADSTIALHVKGDEQSGVTAPAIMRSSEIEANLPQKVMETGDEVVQTIGLDAPESSERNGNYLGNFTTPSPLSPIEAAVKLPDQVQRQEIKRQENKEQAVDSPQPPEAFTVQKKSKPNSIFHELQACKEAINTASQDSADPTLYKILYKNVSAFTKSYELMEKVFKVYTYKDGRKPLVHTGPLIGIYASEGQFIERMKRASAFLTDDPSLAHMFFLPYSVQHMVANLYVPNSHTMLPLATFIKEYVETLARRYPYWNRTQGADHFFVSCHDWGPATARDHPTLRSNAMKVVCNADLTEEFVLGKDGSLPEVNIHPKSKGALKLGGPGYNKRPYLAFFAGQMHGRVRPILLDHWKEKDPDMKIYEVLPESIARTTSYIQHMKMSKYCVCAMGYEVNSPRIVEAIYNDCVPVIIADNFVLPFSDVLNWNTFSVTIPESDISKLKAILSDIPERSYRSMQARLRKVRQHFVWHEKPEKYDVFHMILHSVWTSRLHRFEQVRESSSELF